MIVQGMHKSRSGLNGTNLLTAAARPVFCLVSPLEVEFGSGGLCLPHLGLWLDPHEPQTGPDLVFISHAHSDHIAPHREVVLSEPTARLMEERLPGVRKEHMLKFRETRRFQCGQSAFSLTLFPAGHIFGSATALVEAGAERLLYTGDFKLRRGLSAEPCQPQPADILIMESTFGRPQYVFPPTEAILHGVIRFCSEALDNDDTPVLLGYSLGKSQELLCGLADAGLPLMLHGTVFRLTQVYEQFGQCFPKYERYNATSAHGKVLLCPPHVVNSAMLRNLGKTRTAILTGWAVDPNCRYRYQCDAAFPLSDHADFPELIEMVKQVAPKKVYTVHGFAADFAQRLRDLGYDAQALSQQEQFTLALESETNLNRPVSATSETQKAEKENEAGEIATDRPLVIKSSRTDAFQLFAITCSRIAAEPRKLIKIDLLAEYLRSLSSDGIGLAATWFTGHPFASSQNKVLQLGWAVLRDALCAAAGLDEPALHQIYLKYSDLGETAQEALQRHHVEPTLTLTQVAALFAQLHAMRGPLAKTPLLRAAFERCTPMEAKFLVKIITGDLRVGLKEGLVEEAIASAFKRPVESVRQADLLTGDIGKTAILASEDRLNEATVTPFRAIRFMLASPEETASDVLARVQGRSRTTQKLGGQEVSESIVEARHATRVWLEDKYDGIRCQLHKVGSRVALYSRDLKEITDTFQDLADSARKITADFILDGEIVAMRQDEVLPFSELQKRLGRKEADLFMRHEVPVAFVAFDVLWLSGNDQLAHPLTERRRALEGLAPFPSGLRLAQITEAASVAEIEGAFNAARSRGNEGLMIKDPDSIYSPGRRGLAWLKLKKAFATLDCVVVGAEYGHGKRAKVLSDYTFAVRDDNTGELRIIGKAYTGLTDTEILELTNHFKKTAIRQHGRYFEVPPDTVLEIAFDRLQTSNRHNSGLAMRFPRIVRIRTDKLAGEIDTLLTAQRLAKGGKRDSEPG